MKRFKSIIALICCFLVLTGFTTIPNRISTNGEDTGVLREITFEQMVAEIADLNNLSREIVESQMKRSIADKLMSSSLTTSNLKVQVEDYIASSTYWSKRQQFTVTSEYKPSLVFYYEGYPGDRLGYIKTLLNVSMDRSYYNGFSTITKQFGGNVYVNLEASDRLYFEVNGDFYNNGTTTTNGGLKIDIGGFGSVSFGASHTSNHFKYIYTTGYYRVYNFGDI